MDTSAISREIYVDQVNRLAYSIGFFLGDGCLYSCVVMQEGKSYPRNVFFVAKPDLECIERVQSQIADVFGKSYAISELTERSGRTTYRLQAYRREIFDFFAVNTAMKTKIPEIVFSADDDVKREVIAGLIDSDGFVSHNLHKNGTTQRWQLGFETTSRDMVCGLAGLLQTLGVKVGSVGERQRGGYKTSWHIQPNISSFIQCGCYLHSKRKGERLKNYLDHVYASETLCTTPST